MKKYKGIHFYICITNFNEIINDEEDQLGKPIHSIHMLDTFFTSIENYGKKLSSSLVVEKITGARLHLFVIQNYGEKMDSVYDVVKKVVCYTYRLKEIINKEIGKYKSIKDLTINIGAASGRFYDFEFSTEDGYSEYTTIGYAPNFAAKLQSLSEDNYFSISQDIYMALNDDNRYSYTKIKEPQIKKYDQDCYYSVLIKKIVPILEVFSNEEIIKIKEYANRINLNDMEFNYLTKQLDYSHLNSQKCNTFYGIPLFADVRGFTAKFDSDDSNLDEMSYQVMSILQTMYNTVISNDGVHIQCQGDREFAVFCEYNENKKGNNYCSCFKKAVITAMRLIDKIKNFGVHIGVGESYGKMFATKIGARGEKDNILIGNTVALADTMEDQNASEDEIAITKEVYDAIKKEDDYLAKEFINKGDYYVTKVGYSRFLNNRSRIQLSKNNFQHNYNGAWGVNS